MISSILFDFGGTLDADGGHWLNRFWAIYEQIGLGQIPKERIKEAFYWADAQAEADPAMKSSGYRDMMTRHVRWQFEKLGLRDTKREAEAAAAFYKPSERVLHRNCHVLEKLSQMGFKIGVISNFYGNVEVLCREAGYEPFLSLVLDSAVVGLRKPDTKFYELALQKLGTSADATAMVGDSFERDILPAKALGMKTYWMLGDSDRNPPDPSKVDGVLHSLEDLVGMLPSPHPLPKGEGGTGLLPPGEGGRRPDEGESTS
jgi:putative hydrolase of the HAD superfamily